MGRSRWVKIVKGVKSVGGGGGRGGIRADMSALCREAALSALKEDLGAQLVRVWEGCEGCGGVGGRYRGSRHLCGCIGKLRYQQISGASKWVSKGVKGEGRAEKALLCQLLSNSNSCALWLFVDRLTDRVRCMLLPATACRCADATLTVRSSWWAPAPPHHHRWRRCTASSAAQALWREHPALEKGGDITPLLVPTCKSCLLLDKESLDNGLRGGVLRWETPTQ